MGPQRGKNVSVDNHFVRSALTELNNVNEVVVTGVLIGMVTLPTSPHCEHRHGLILEGTIREGRTCVQHLPPNL